MKSGSIDTLWHDVRYAVRGLHRTPVFTIAAVLTLALGIGANTAIFSLLDAVMFKPLPVAAPDELFVAYEVAPEEVSDVDGGTGRLMRFSYLRFQDLQAAMASSGTLTGMTRVTRLAVRLSQDQAPTVARGQLVTGRYFDTFRVTPAVGRLLSDDDNRQVDGHPYAVISHSYWQRQFGGARDVAGRGIVLNGTPFTIIGVAAAPFTGPWSDTRVDVWVPAAMQHALHYRENSSATNSDLTQAWIPQDGIAWLNLVGRTRRDEHDAVHQRLDVVNRRGLQRFASILGAGDEQQRAIARRLRIEPFERGFSGLRTRFSDALFMLTAMVGLVLLIACANIANLLLARSSARQREMGIRLSIGATRARLIHQCLIESLVLAALGGAGGLMVGLWASGALAAVALNSPAALPPGFTVNIRLAAYAALVSLATAFIFGLAPALRATGTAAATVLAGRTRAAGRTMHGMRRLVATQLALSFMVIVAAALFARSLNNYVRLDPGFERESLVVVAMDSLISGYSREELPVLNRRLVETVATLPGVGSSVVSSCGLASGCQSISDFRFEGYHPAPGEAVELHENRVGPAYFSTVGMQVVDGRDFSERDTADTPRVAVITELAAERYFAGRSPIGKRVGYDENLEAEIVGVVRDARITSLREAPAPTVYFAIEQLQTQTVARTLEIRVTGDPQRAVAAIRDALRRTDPGLVLDRVVTMNQQLDQNVTQERLVTRLTSGFGVLALFMACVGLYGVLAYSVERRTREIGVRMALGAQPASLIRMVLGDGMRVAAAGVATGLVLALLASRLMSSLLFGVSALDVPTYAAAIAMLAAVALLACYVPARRAAAIHPVDALRSE